MIEELFGLDIYKASILLTRIYTWSVKHFIFVWRSVEMIVSDDSPATTAYNYSSVTADCGSFDATSPVIV